MTTYIGLFLLLISSVGYSKDSIPLHTSNKLLDNNKAFSLQRKRYANAKQSFKKGHLANYRRLKKQLRHYPLYPYLEYNELIKKLHTYPYKEIDRFLQANQQTYLGDKLRARWLRRLANKKKWKDYQRYYQASLPQTSLKCLYLRSFLATEKKLLVEETQALWLVPHSQADACNSVFHQWEKRGHLSQELLWQRHGMVVAKGRLKLARHLRSKMNADNKSLALLFEQVHKNPAQVKVIKQFSKKPAQVADIVFHGLYRYAHYRPLETLKLLSRYQKTYSFKQDKINELNARLAVSLIRKDKIKQAQKLLEKLPADSFSDEIEKLLQKLLKKQQWAQVRYWIDLLPAEIAKSDRWQYWKARAIESIANRQQQKHSNKETTSPTENYHSIYKRLAKKRSFYGFLSADKIQAAYQFEDQPAPINLESITRVRKAPGLQRAKELFLLEEMHYARREWAYAITGFSRQETIASGQLAYLWGWHRKAIEAMSKAKYWDDITIRFPIAHEDIINNAAQSRAISPSLIFAIARQESAWEFDAKSRVGARGLMQLMPATARETAKKAKVRYHQEKLYSPKYNIHLGSHYISDLLKHYNNNRPLAIAAYNAGPHRVKRWLKKTDRKLPSDIWIEIIPFSETRKYVQNVLSYSLIYNYRRGQKQMLLTAPELQARL